LIVVSARAGALRRSELEDAEPIEGDDEFIPTSKAPNGNVWASIVNFDLEQPNAPDPIVWRGSTILLADLPRRRRRVVRQFNDGSDGLTSCPMGTLCSRPTRLLEFRTATGPPCRRARSGTSIAPTAPSGSSDGFSGCP
jgi:hypothetical protein